MKPGETVYLGDGAYLRHEGFRLCFMANDHNHPTDRVYVDMNDWARLAAILNRVMNPEDSDVQ